jgi:hypothetical protein
MFVLCVVKRTKVQIKLDRLNRWATPVVIQRSNLGQNKIGN